jgi:hypothetical protein
MTNAWAQLLDRLFDSQRELARLLCIEMGLGEEKLASTAVFLSQIMNNRRRLPTKWELAVRTVIERRAHEREVSEREISGLLSMIEISGMGGLSRLIRAQTTASHTLILNARPIELTDVARDHREAEKLQAITFAAIEAGAHYHYCLGSQVSARRLWQVLLRSAQARFGTDATTRVQQWSDDGRLNISIVPELLLLHPTVAYNMTQPDRLSVFVWHAPYDWTECYALPDRTLAAWLGHVQSVLDTQSELLPFAA